jgi:hypothetical protein
VQAAILQLEKLGPFPAEAARDVARLKAIQELLEQVETPVSDDDARVLVKLFGPDDCYGVAWTLLHLIETAPKWPLADCLVDTENEWIKVLKQRLANAAKE